MGWISSGASTYDSKEQLFDAVNFSVEYDLSSHAAEQYDRGFNTHNCGNFATVKEATAAVEKIDSRRYDVVYATYGKDNQAKITKQIEQIKEKRRKYFKDNLPCYFKSALITCPVCGSKLSTKRLKGYDCPVCEAYSSGAGYHSLMSKTVKETLNRYDEKIAELEKEKNKKPALKCVGKYDLYCG